MAASPVVKPLPRVVWAVAEKEVLLPCEASGIPRPSITWQREGLSVPTGECPQQPVQVGREQQEPGGLLPAQGPRHICWEVLKAPCPAPAQRLITHTLPPLHFLPPVTTPVPGLLPERSVAGLGG